MVTIFIDYAINGLFQNPLFFATILNNCMCHPSVRHLEYLAKVSEKSWVLLTKCDPYKIYAAGRKTPD